MRPAALAAAAALDRESMGKGWSEAQFRAELEQSAAFQFAARPAAGLPLIGFICGRQVADEVEILRLAVSVSARRRGVASNLLRRALVHCARQGGSICFLEVRASNTAAQQLYLKDGFEVVGRRRGYYSDPEEDALLLRRPLVNESGPDRDLGRECEKYQ